MPAAIPLALSAGSAIYGAIKKKKDQKAQQTALDQQLAAQSAGGGGGGSSFSHPNAAAMAGLGEFAKTGGFSAEDLQNIRARALSPVRATYANAEREVNRQRAIQGGYSPGFNVMQGRMAREQGQATSDAATGAESSIAQMVQQGKLAGLTGMAAYGREEGSSSGGGTGVSPVAPEQKQGFWGKFGDIAGQVGDVALPILMNRYGNGPAAKPLPSRSIPQMGPFSPGLPSPNVSGSLPGFGG